MGWLLRKLLNLGALILFLGVVGLASLRWIPFPPRPVLEAAFSGQPYQWKWLSEQQQPVPLREAFAWYSTRTLRAEKPSLAELTARYMFFSEDTPSWLVKLVGALLEPLWGQDRVLTYYLNAIPFRGAEDLPVYGVGAASRYLYRRLVEELSPREWAELVVRQRWPSLEEPLPTALQASYGQVYRFLLAKQADHGSQARR